MSPDHCHHAGRVGHGHSSTAVTTDSGTGPMKVAGVPCDTNSGYTEGQGHHSAFCNSSRDVKGQGHYNQALGFIKVVQCKKQRCVHTVWHIPPNGKVPSKLKYFLLEGKGLMSLRR